MMKTTMEVTDRLKEVTDRYTEQFMAKYGSAKQWVVMAIYWELKELGGNEGDIGLFLDNVDRLTLDRKLVSKGGDVLAQLYPGTESIAELRTRIVGRQFDKVHVVKEELVEAYELPLTLINELVKSEWLGVDQTGAILDGFKAACEEYGDIMQVLIKNHPKDEADAVNYFKENCKKYYEFVYDMGKEPDRKDLVKKYVIMSDPQLNAQLHNQPKEKRMAFLRARAGLPTINLALMDYLGGIVPKKEYDAFYKALVQLPFDKLKEETEKVAAEWLAIGSKTNKAYSLRDYKYGYLYRKVNGRMANMCYPVTNVFYLGDLGTIGAEVTPKKEILASGGTEEQCISLAKLFKGEAIRVRDVGNIGKELLCYFDVSDGESFKKLLFRVESLINKHSFNDLYEVLLKLPELTKEQEEQLYTLVK